MRLLFVVLVSVGLLLGPFGLTDRPALAQPNLPMSDADAAKIAAKALAEIGLSPGVEVGLPSKRAVEMATFRVAHAEQFGGWFGLLVLKLPDLDRDLDNWNAQRADLLRKDQRAVCDQYGERLMQLFRRLTPPERTSQLSIRFEGDPSPSLPNSMSPHFDSTYFFDSAPCQSRLDKDRHEDSFVLPQADGSTRILLESGEQAYMRKQKVKGYTVVGGRQAIGYKFEFNLLAGRHKGREAEYAPRLCAWFARQIGRHGGSAKFKGEFIWIEFGQIAGGSATSLNAGTLFIYLLENTTCRRTNMKLE